MHLPLRIHKVCHTHYLFVHKRLWSYWTSHLQAMVLELDKVLVILTTVSLGWTYSKDRSNYKKGYVGICERKWHLKEAWEIRM